MTDTTWDLADMAFAIQEGWNVIPYVGELRSVNIDVFPEDSDVWLHVKFWASMGSPVHCRALDYLEAVSPGEFAMVMGWMP